MKILLIPRDVETECNPKRRLSVSSARERLTAVLSRVQSLRQSVYGCGRVPHRCTLQSERGLRVRHPGATRNATPRAVRQGASEHLIGPKLL